jgi:LSD1 subclass zinc finger protein
MTRTGRLVAGALLLAVASTGCAGCTGADDSDDTGPNVPLAQDRPTDANHPGWGSADCSACHAIADQHEGRFTLVQCVECHGINGAVALDAGHEGWAASTAYDCWACHEEADTPHVGSLAPGTCAVCHGGNGAPSQNLGHFTSGAGRVRCATCHPETAVHGGRFAAADCGGCHAVDGAPRRPDPHYVIECARCHADGSAPWDEATHADTEPESPVGCALCHPLAP